MKAEQSNYTVIASPNADAVTLLIAEVGGFRMTAVGAAYLAQQLLDAANVAKPGAGGIRIGGQWDA